MKKNKSEAGNQSVIAIILKAVICAAAVVVIVYFVGLLILLWGLSKLPSRHNTKEEYQKQCKTELESWFAEREPDAVWDGTFSVVQYVCSSTKMARSLADAGYGEITQNLSAPTSYNGVCIKPGDVVSIKGHVWVSLGTCEDGSVVIVHSTNGFVSRTGQPGGVAIGAIGTTTDCEAYRLAERYMRKYFPQWDERYTVALSNPETYFNLEGDVAGWFSWNPESAEGLTDEEHVQDMTPAEVLRLCFGE